jgi:CelD/BcsL family acetyltransferase involved in cellulose biosynthesis
MIVRVEIDDPGWMEFVSASERASAFHHPAWAALLGECYGYSAFALVLHDSAGRIVAGLPVLDVSNRLRGKRWVSLPYTDVCPPLVAPGTSGEELVAALDQERRLRNIPEFEFRAKLPGMEGQRRSESVIHVLPLAADPDQMDRGFKRSVRQHIAKGHRAGVTVRRAERVGDVADTFYGLQVRTRRRQGVPVQPRRYFVRLWERILEPGLGFCSLAYSNSRPVAGAVFLALKETVVYKYSASDHSQLSLRPNYVLLSEAIRLSCVNGYSMLDLGRSDLEHGGLRHFKSSWGAREEPLVYSTLGEARGGSGLYSRGASLLSPAIRHSPSGVCRAIGELLYRYAA